MLTIHPLSDPDLHRAACRIVNRVAFMVQPALRNVEKRDFLMRSVRHRPRGAGAV